MAEEPENSPEAAVGGCVEKSVGSEKGHFERGTSIIWGIVTGMNQEELDRYDKVIGMDESPQKQSALKKLLITSGARRGDMNEGQLVAFFDDMERWNAAIQAARETCRELSPAAPPPVVGAQQKGHSGKSKTGGR